MCKAPKNVDFAETVQFFLFVWFEKFPMDLFPCWEDKTYSLPCVLLGCKNVQKSLQKIISNIKNCKNIQKSSKYPKRNTQKEANIIS